MSHRSKNSPSCEQSAMANRPWCRGIPNAQRLHGRQAADSRLAQIDREWDTDRVIEMGTPLAVMAGLLLANSVSRKWLWLPMATCGMLLYKNLQGQDPFLPLLRVFGIRTASEINHERSAIKALRGDFR